MTDNKSLYQFIEVTIIRGKSSFYGGLRSKRGGSKHFRQSICIFKKIPQKGGGGRTYPLDLSLNSCESELYALFSHIQEYIGVGSVLIEQNIDTEQVARQFGKGLHEAREQ